VIRHAFRSSPTRDLGARLASCLAAWLAVWSPVWLGASLASCSRAPGADAAPASAARSAAQGAAASLPFLEKIPEAPSSVAYSGERHVRLSYVVAGTLKDLEYDETVHSDGHGRFSIVPGKVSAPAMTDDEAAFFAILQERRDGFFYRYRDFRIRDLRAFLRNWSATDQGLRETVAGRECAVLEFRKVRGDGSRYKAWIDVSTGLVMRAEEFDAQGARVGLVEFREFTLAPDLSTLALHGDRSEPKALDLSTDTTTALGFQVLRPKILPDGYRLERAESVTAEAASNPGAGAPNETRGEPRGERWARIAYGDGVEQIFFLQSLSPDAAQASTAPGEVDVGSRFVRVFHVGPWTVLQGQFDRTRAIVMGKVDEASLLRMLKSAVR
jgi:hypothetical protein